MKNEPWASERVEKLKELAAKGWSCGMIANELGITRNAVIGKLSRMGIERNKRRTNVDRFSIPRRKTFSRPPKVIVLPFRPSTDSVSFFDLKDHQCRFPVAGEGMHTLFCGAGKLDSHSYCPYHYQVAHEFRSVKKVA